MIALKQIVYNSSDMDVLLFRASVILWEPSTLQQFMQIVYVLRIPYVLHVEMMEV